MDNQYRLDVINGIRRAAEKFKHHQNFTKRVTPYLEAEFPGKTVSIHTSQKRFDSHRIGIWGGDIHYKELIEISFDSRKDKTWFEDLLYQLDVADPSDQMERERDEESIYFQDFENQIKMRQEAIDRIKDIALAQIKDLPVPSSAKIRTSQCHWDSPSSVLREKYPHLFGIKG